MSHPKVSESIFSPFYSPMPSIKRPEATEVGEPLLVAALGHLILLGLEVVPLPVARLVYHQLPRPGQSKGQLGALK